MTHKFPTYSIKGRPVEYKTFHFQLKSINEDEGTVTGYLSTFGNVDLQKDRVVQGAFRKTLTEAYARKSNGRKYLFAMLWMHDPEQPIGGFTGAEETDEGLLVTAQLDISVNSAGIPNNPNATMVFSGFKSGYVDEMSMGYLAVQKEFDGGIRNLKECALLEGSAVTMLFAANPEALVPPSGVKSVEQKTEDKPTDTPQQQKDFNQLLQAAQAKDCLEDWTDLISVLTQAMFQLFGMGSNPQADMITCLEQFGVAVNAWMDEATTCNLAQYIVDRGYCGDNTPYVPYSMRPGGYDFASRHYKPESKAGRTISEATQSSLEQHQQAMDEHLAEMSRRCSQMQEQMKGLSALWQVDKEPDNTDGKSITRREPSIPALTREQPLQPLQGNKSTVKDDLTIADLESLLV